MCCHLDPKFWEKKLDETMRIALQPIDNKWHSLFICVGPTSLSYLDYCPDNGANILCQPRDNTACRVNGQPGRDSCCGPNRG